MNKSSLTSSETRGNDLDVTNHLAGIRAVDAPDGNRAVASALCYPPWVWSEYLLCEAELATCRSSSRMNAAVNRVRDLMTRDVLMVRPDMEIMRAVHLLVANDVSGVPVVDRHGQLLGILTERDCIKIALHAGYFDELGGQVRRYMTKPVETVTPNMLLMDVAERFAGAPLRRYPVVQEGRLVGMIFRRDILRALSSGTWFPTGLD